MTNPVESPLDLTGAVHARSALTGEKPGVLVLANKGWGCGSALRDLLLRMVICATGFRCPSV